MIGTLAERSSGVVGPWPGGSSRTFARGEVAAFGKLRRHGDFVSRYIVRLSDGAEVFVRVSDQPKDDARWLRKVARFREDHAYPSRDNPCAISWNVLLAALIALMLTACVAELPDAPAVRIVAPSCEVDTYLAGARAWSPLGFSATFEASGMPECGRRWYAHGERSCELTIGLLREDHLRERTGTNALSYRDFREIRIDSRVTDELELLAAVAHEVGHIVLDTERHDGDGIMAGQDWIMHESDFAIACESIGICP